MRRRELITTLGSAVLTLPLNSRAQQASKVPLVGVLWHAGSVEEEAPYFRALVQEFKNLGYVDHVNIN